MIFDSCYFNAYFSVASQKPDKLELTDLVQRIRKVGKDRASNLQKKNIKTVEDFLWWYYNDQPELCKVRILGYNFYVTLANLSVVPVLDLNSANTNM